MPARTPTDLCYADHLRVQPTCAVTSPPSQPIDIGISRYRSMSRSPTPLSRPAESTDGLFDRRRLHSRKTAKTPPEGGVFTLEIRRRPTLPGGLPPSTIGAGGLNFRVRNGNGCGPTAMATEIFVKGDRLSALYYPLRNSIASTNIIVNPRPRPISTGRLNTLPCLHLRPINVIVYHGPYLVNPVGDLI